MVSAKVQKICWIEDKDPKEQLDFSDKDRLITLNFKGIFQVLLSVDGDEKLAYMAGNFWLPYEELSDGTFVALNRKPFAHVTMPFVCFTNTYSEAIDAIRTDLKYSYALEDYPESSLKAWRAGDMSVSLNEVLEKENRSFPVEIN